MVERNPSNQNFNLQNTQGNYSTGISNYNQQMYLTPQVDILEDDSTIYYVYELPGIDPGQLNVELSEDSVFIEGKMDVNVDDQSEPDFLYQERSKGSFFRKMQLPMNVDSDAAKANFTNGLLKISFPKTNNF